MNRQLFEALMQKRIIVCCGAGGVGKTTVSASLAVALARRGKKVLILTIDPSLRLAEVLGVNNSPPEPLPLPDDTLFELGIEKPGILYAWMLDSMRVAESTIRAVIEDKAELNQFLTNPIYRQLSTMTAGMHEYAAMKALHTFVESGEFDVVVVDTPPSRHALDFLDAPKRLQRLFDLKVMKYLRPSTKSRLRKLSANVALGTIRAITGSRFVDDFVFFLTQFERVFNSLEAGASSVRALLSTDSASFVLVTSPQETSVNEAFLFQDTAKRLRLPLGGFVFNRSSAFLNRWNFPHESSFSKAIPARIVGAFQQMAREEQQLAARDLEVLRRVRMRAGDEAFVIDLPLFEADQADLHRLFRVSELLLNESASPGHEVDIPKKGGNDAKHRVQA